MKEDSPLTRRGALQVAAALGIALGARAVPVPAGSAEPALAPGASSPLRRGYADGPYGQIHYRCVRPASAPAARLPLLCLHPSPLSGIVYDNWLIEMGRDRVALAPDTPGYGSSAAPPAPPQIGDYAAACIRLLDELRLARVDVMGYHTGSLTAIEMARRHPDRVHKVVMISAPIFTAEELAGLRAQVLRTPTYEEMLAAALESWRTQGKGMFRDEPTDERYADLQTERMRSYRIASWGFRAAFNYDLAAALPEVAQPILILNPQDDLWTMTPRALRYAKTATVHNLPGWTHGHLDAHTSAMAAIVRAFLDADSPRAAQRPA